MQETGLITEQKHDLHEKTVHTGLAHSFMNWFSGVSAAISMAPFVLSAFDVGKVKEVRNIIDYNGACCTVIANKKAPWSENYSFSSIPKDSIFKGLDGTQHAIQGPSYGIAGFTSSLLMKIPGVGYHLGTGHLPEPVNEQLRKIPKVGNYLAELKLANALTAGGIIMLGELTGSTLEKWEKEQAIKKAQSSGEDVAEAEQKAGSIGRAVSVGSKGMGLFIALPTILAGVGHAIQVTTATFGMDKISNIEKPEGIGGHIMAFLGKPMGECGGQYKAPTGTATASVVGLCCAIPAAIAAISTLIPHLTSEKPSRTTTMQNTKLPEELSVIKDDLGLVVNHHHSIPWERFEKESQELDSRIERLQEEVAAKEKWGGVAKWATRIVGTVAAFTAGYFLLKKSANDNVTPSQIDTSAANTALNAFDDAKKAGSPMLPVNRAEGVTPEQYPLLGEPGSENIIKKFIEDVKALPDKIRFKRIRDNVMTDKDGNLAGCCINQESGCCGIPYYKKDIPEALYNALNGLLKQLPEQQDNGNSSVKANRQLAFAGGMTIAVGAFAWLGNKVEEIISAEPKQKLQELLTRKKVIDGLKGHWQRDMMTDKHEMLAAHQR